MSLKPRLDGAVPLDSGSSQEVALAALSRRVAELEHRLNVMKIIVGLVLAGKVLLVVLFLYIVFGGGFVVRSGGPIRPDDAANLQLRPIRDLTWFPRARA